MGIGSDNLPGIQNRFTIGISSLSLSRDVLEGL